MTHKVEDMERRFNIEGLCRRVGVKRRTVHFYVQEKLLPPPAGRGMGGFYDERHVAILTEILRLRKEGRSLAAIGEILRSAHGRKVVEEMLDTGENLAALPHSVPSTDQHVTDAYVCVRFTVAPGVEILVDQKVVERMPWKVRQLFEHAEEIFKTEEDK
jgi:DNA-binding transcriptional MerR regulator